ncbi:MAG: magnesium transporter, partial [Candidatus Bathyarchaeia archaeon]
MAIRAKIFELLSNVMQSTLSLSFNLGGLVAGGILALYLDVFSISPWMIVLFPCVLSVRGAIGGLFSGRLSTALHLGTVKASYTNNTKSFNLLLASIVTLAFESSIIMGTATFILGSFLWRMPLENYLPMLAVVSGTMGLSILVISPITMAASFISFKHGMDPDVIVYPITSTVADIFVTLCYVIVLEVFFLTHSGYYFVYLIDLVFTLVALILLAKNSKEIEFIKTLKEF